MLQGDRHGVRCCVQQVGGGGHRGLSSSSRPSLLGRQWAQAPRCTALTPVPAPCWLSAHPTAPGWWQVAQSPSQSPLLRGPNTSKADLALGFGGCVGAMHQQSLSLFLTCLRSQLLARPGAGGALRLGGQGRVLTVPVQQDISWKAIPGLNFSSEQWGQLSPMKWEGWELYLVVITMVMKMMIIAKTF